MGVLSDLVRLWPGETCRFDRATEATATATVRRSGTRPPVTAREDLRGSHAMNEPLLVVLDESLDER